MRSIFALVDCNNFYASCERVFNPKLEGKPVVVLSNNDGCIIARSEEAKELGIKMGTPLFKAQQMLKEQGVHVYSSNYPLYGDMSQRVMKTLGQFTPDVEVYSIDEAFLDLTHCGGKELEECGRTIRATVKQWTGMPVSVGIAPTKTLAKIANHFAKRSKKRDGVLELTDPDTIEKALANTRVEDVWGVGRNWSKLLRSQHISTALDLRNFSEGWIRRKMGVVGLRMVQELRGVPCITVETGPYSRRGVSWTRSFANAIESIEDVHEAIAAFASKTGEKLRRARLAARGMVVFLGTSRWSDDDYFNSTFVEIPVATDDTPELIEYALYAVDRIYREGRRYKRAGVMLVELIPVSNVQTEIFDGRDRERSKRLMSIVDDANSRMGSGTIRYASTGVNHRWLSRSAMRSARYTTSWDEIPTVRA